MKVTRLLVLARGLAGCCPNCGHRTLFAAGRVFKVNETCPDCGLRIDRGEGAFLGPFVLNYAAAAFGVIIPLILLHLWGFLGSLATLVLCFVGAFVVPLALYRISWGWWLALYYCFLPDNLPANLEGRAEDDE
jgi:uncharacterized protein (DUF983 family)